VKVPKITGLAPLDAECALERRGLRWSYRGVAGPLPFEDACAARAAEPSPGGSASVTYQRPAPGSRVRPGRRVVFETCSARGCA
jgi:hypothetical protein